jgi:hypothetical protein
MCWSGGAALKQPTGTGCGMIVLWLKASEQKGEKIIFFLSLSSHSPAPHSLERFGF